MYYIINNKITKEKTIEFIHTHIYLCYIFVIMSLYSFNVTYQQYFVYIRHKLYRMSSTAVSGPLSVLQTHKPTRDPKK